MGHVNHGKTSLLDVIRGTHVQESEAGGITQNTRAHQVDYQGYRLTFIDTPGHEAFSEMRSRGAQVTDIVMLVVAADDGVQPQTKESIKFALKAKVPVVVAINKTDIPGKNIEKLKQELSSAGLMLEDYGGDVIVTEVSAKKETNISGLIENLLLVAELHSLKKRKLKENSVAHGFVLESNLDKNLGPVALVLIQAGSVTNRDYLAYSGKHDRIRSLLDESQKHLEKADEGDPIWITGLNQVLKTGEIISFYTEEKQAKQIANKYSIPEVVEEIEVPVEEGEQVPTEGEAALDLLASLINTAKTEEEIRYLNVVLKTSAAGTLEAVAEQLENLDSDKVKIKKPPHIFEGVIIMPGAPAEIKEIKGQFEEQKRHKGRGVIGSAVGHDKGRREGVLQADHDIAKGQDQQPWCQQRQRNAQKRLPDAGAVDTRHFVVDLGNGLEADQQHHHALADGEQCHQHEAHASRCRID